MQPSKLVGKKVISQPLISFTHICHDLFLPCSTDIPRNARPTSLPTLLLRSTLSHVSKSDLIYAVIFLGPNHVNRKCCVLPDHSLATHIRPLELLIPYTYLINLYIFQISAIPYFRVFPACSVPHISAACNKVNTITYTISSTLLCIHIQLPTFPQILPISYTLSLSHTYIYKYAWHKTLCFATFVPRARHYFPFVHINLERLCLTHSSILVY